MNSELDRRTIDKLTLMIEVNKLDDLDKFEIMDKDDF